MKPLREALHTNYRKMRGILLERIRNPWWCMGFALLAGLAFLEVYAGGAFGAVKFMTSVVLGVLNEDDSYWENLDDVFELLARIVDA
jgi:hypothetical protein